jgi:hypothetical protein
MAESRDRDPLGSTSESETETPDARLERRKRRQELKASSTAIIDETVLDDTDSQDEGVKECEERMRRIRTTPLDSKIVAECSSPNKNPNVVCANASPSGAGTSQKNAADPSDAAGKTADLNGAGQPQVEHFDLGQYTTIKALRKNMKTNPCLRGGGGKGAC